MKLSFKLTMQGLIRTLRALGHDLAEEVEREPVKQPARRTRRKRETGQGDGNGIRRD